MAAISLKRKYIHLVEATLAVHNTLASSSADPHRREEWSGPKSSEGSCDSLRSDAISSTTKQDDVEACARALIKVAEKSPDAVRQFVRRLTPARIAKSLDWDLLETDKLTKMAGHGNHWTADELQAFLDSCLEEIAARNITSSCPKATGLGINPYTNFIDAPLPREWWEAMERRRKGVRAFKNGPLLFIAEHHAVFWGRMVVGNHSAVAGAELNLQGPVPQQAQILDVGTLTDIQQASLSPNPSKHARRRKGREWPPLAVLTVARPKRAIAA